MGFYIRSHQELYVNHSEPCIQVLRLLEMPWYLLAAASRKRSSWCLLGCQVCCNSGRQCNPPGRQNVGVGREWSTANDRQLIKKSTCFKDALSAVQRTSSVSYTNQLQHNLPCRIMAFFMGNAHWPK